MNQPKIWEAARISRVPYDRTNEEVRMEVKLD
jgi:hypothetical protein